MQKGGGGMLEPPKHCVFRSEHGSTINNTDHYDGYRLTTTKELWKEYTPSLSKPTDHLCSIMDAYT